MQSICMNYNNVAKALFTSGESTSFAHYALHVYSVSAS